MGQVTLVVDVLDVHPLAIVRAVLSVPSGRSWTLTGTSRDWSWQVAAGVSDGGEVVVSDPWAPLGVSATYTLTHAGTQEQSGPITRAWGGGSAITDLTGRVVVGFQWMARGGDPQEGGRRGSFFDVAGSPLPVPVYAANAGAGGGSLLTQTTRPDTDVLRTLLATDGPVILLHDLAACQVPDCDTAPARTVYLTSDENDRTRRRDAATRAWSLSYRYVPVPAGFLPPVVTVADVAAHFGTVQGLTDSGLTVSQLRRGDWLADVLELGEQFFVSRLVPGALPGEFVLTTEGVA